MFFKKAHLINPPGSASSWPHNISKYKNILPTPENAIFQGGVISAEYKKITLFVKGDSMTRTSELILAVVAIIVASLYSGTKCQHTNCGGLLPLNFLEFRIWI